MNKNSACIIKQRLISFLMIQYHDKDGKVMRHPGQKGDEIRISKVVKMTSSNNNKAELFYKVAAEGGDFIKASEIKYLA